MDQENANDSFIAANMSPKSKIRDLEDLIVGIDSMISGKRLELRELEDERMGIEAFIATLARAEIKTGW